MKGGASIRSRVRGARMENDVARVLLAEEEIRTGLRRIAERLTADYRGRDVTVVAVLHGSCVFVSDLIRLLPIPLTLEFLACSSYGGGTVSSGEVRMVDLINSHRVSAGLNALVVHPVMEDAARAHSIHMPLHGFVGSRNPEGDDEHDRAHILLISHFDYDEITGGNAPDPFVMFDAWLVSPPAHDMIDDPFWTHLGVGQNGSTWTADFAER